jgi:hypothetical protein
MPVIVFFTNNVAFRENPQAGAHSSAIDHLHRRSS